MLLYLDETSKDPLTPPNVDIATDIGMIHAITPNKLFPRVCNANNNIVENIAFDSVIEIH